MANKRFGEDFIEYTAPPKDDDMLLMLSSDDKKTYKTKRSELFRNVNVEYTVFQFAKNASKNVAPKVGWTEAPPITEDNEWLWIRQGKITPLTSSLPVWSTPVRIKGEQGASEVYVGKTPPTDGTFQIAIDLEGDLNGGIPAGGKTGDVLTKTSNSDFATAWSSPLRPLFIARGAVWNAVTGFYELNGLTDITEAEMIDIYAQTSTSFSLPNCCERYASNTFRTNFKWFPNYPGGQYVTSVDARAMFYNCKYAKIININNFYPKFINYLFHECTALETILGELNLRENFKEIIRKPFNSCKLLKNIKIKTLRVDMPINESPLLTRDSIVYLITNAANTTPITVTLHEEAKARLTEADIALASSKNITIA